MHKEVEAFLSRHQMHFDLIDWNGETRFLAKQMKAGLEGVPSSLMMIPSFVMLKRQIPAGEKTIVVDAGGTNLRVAIACSQQNGEVALSQFQKFPMPGTDGALTVDEFFERLSARLEPVLDECDNIGICFSFPCEISPERDGKILGFSKEVRITGAEGRMLGESLNRVFVRRGHKTKRITVLNDTVATMMGSLAVTKGHRYDNYIGFILGTGTNTCYVESTAKIKKSSAAQALQGEMVINMESCGYDGFRQGTFDRVLDRESESPGEHKMEKMISGAYQGKLLFLMIKAAAEEGVLSQEFGAAFVERGALLPRDVDAFIARPNGDDWLAELTAGNEEDRSRLYELLSAYYERAARITAVVFSGIALYTEVPAGGSMCVMAEGSVFEKSTLYVKKLTEYIERYLQREMGISCCILSGENTTLVGTAVAALTQEA